MNSKTLLRLAGFLGVLALNACASGTGPSASCSWNGEGSQDENLVCLTPQEERNHDAR